jgi:hypothetical protein
MDHAPTQGKILMASEASFVALGNHSGLSHYDTFIWH